MNNFCYYESSLENPYSQIWDILSFASVSLCLFLFIIQWQLLPFFVDMYYHLGVAKGFEVYGGIALHNFWEYGPSGAPHLYPPLVHTLMFLLLKAGVSGITILRIFSTTIPVIMLITLWYLIRLAINNRVAFFTLFLALCTSLFMIGSSFTPAATLALILFLLALSFLYRGFYYAASLFFGLIFYTHIGVALISVFFLILALLSGLLNIKDFLKIIFVSAFIGSAWCFHIITNLSKVTLQNSANMPITFYPVIIILLIIGILISIKRIKKYKIFFIYFASLIPIAFFYPFRFLSVQGMTGILIFAGIGLDGIYAAIYKKLWQSEILKKYASFFLVILLLYLIFFAPSLSIRKGGLHLKKADSFVSSVFEGKERSPEYILSSAIYNDEFFNNLANIIKRNSMKGDFIWSNYRYVAGILWPLTERRTLSHMLIEVKSKKGKINLNNAELLIIIDEPEHEFKRIYLSVRDTFYPVEKLKVEDFSIYILKKRN